MQGKGPCLAHGNHRTAGLTVAQALHFRAATMNENERLRILLADFDKGARGQKPGISILFSEMNEALSRTEAMLA